MVAKTDGTARSDAAQRCVVEHLSPEEAATYRKVPREVAYVYHESFDSPLTADRLFAGDQPELRPPPWTYSPEPEQTVRAARAKAFTLTREEETRLFLQYNYAMFRLARLQAVRPDAMTVADVRGALLWYRRAMDVRAALVRANLALVVAMVKRFGTRDVDFCDLVSEGNLVMLKCIEVFDVSRGFKFSTYACRAVMRSFGRLAARTERHRQRFPAGFDPDLEQADDPGRRQDDRRSSSIEALHEVLAGGRAGLRDVERTVVLERFGIGSCGRRRSLADLARGLGLCAERVRQIQQRALRKLRVALEDECAAV
jgi:RNA polymerase sigma factor (sigma-70 family)